MHGDFFAQRRQIKLGLWSRPSGRRSREAIMTSFGIRVKFSDSEMEVMQKALDHYLMAPRGQEGQWRALLCKHQAVSDDFKGRAQIRSGCLDG